MTWYKLNRNVSPTKAATDLYNTMNAEKVSVINLGQGRETVELPLLKKLAAKVRGITIGSGYPLPPTTIERSLANWSSRFLGVDGVCACVFAAQGRFGLDRVFHQAAFANDFHEYNSVLGPDSSWPMVNDLVEDYRQYLTLYPMERGKLAAHIREQLDSNKITAVYLNSPHNPTGMQITQDEMNEIMAVMEEYNSEPKLSESGRGGKKIILVVDNPYFHACEQTHHHLEGPCGYLKSGIDNILHEETATPWAVVISFSKAFGLAKPGFSGIVAHPELAAPLSARLLRNTKLSYVDELFEIFNESLQPEHDGEVLSHFADLSDKYHLNWGALNASLGQYVVDGDAGMTALLALPREDFTNRIVDGENGEAYTISDTNDLIEWLANKHGVVTVNNDDPAHPSDKVLLRLAASADPEKYAEAMSRLDSAFAQLLKSPRVAPISESVPGIAPDNQPN